MYVSSLVWVDGNYTDSVYVSIGAEAVSIGVSLVSAAHLVKVPLVQ